MSGKATTGRHQAVNRPSSRHTAVREPVRKKRILSRKVSLYIALCMSAVFMLMISAVLIMNSAEKESYELRMSSATDCFNRKEYEDAGYLYWRL